MFQAIIGTLGYVVRDGSVLLVHRQRVGDDHQGKWNGLGGKVETGEDAVTCLRRELSEEAGIDATSVRLRGTVAWPGFGSDGSDWFGLVFLVESFDGEPPGRNDDGPLAWVPLDEVGNLPMWEGDRYFLPLVFDGDPRLFHAVIPYRDGQVVAEGVAVSRG
ncbi:MAG: 8-oxo-dGTP diphosphatase [Propionibacteriaceae bacterium]|nr:8-oxo-dGTP diphosphatase [Propionibacteriaceae bacterium]